MTTNMLPRLLFMVVVSTTFATAKVGANCPSNINSSSCFPFEHTVDTNRIIVEVTKESDNQIQEYNCYPAGVSSKGIEYGDNSCGSLAQCTNYYVEVKAVNSWGRLLTYTKPIQTLCGCEPLTTITSVKPDTFSIRVSWRTTNVNVVDKFYVHIRGEDFYVQKEVPKSDALEYEYEFTDVMPCHLYILSVITLTEDSSYSTPERATKTQSVDPGPIQRANLKATGPHTATLSWAKPTGTPHCVQYYEVKWKASRCEVGSTGDESGNCIQSKNISADGLNIHFNDLEACETYHVDVNVNGNPADNWNGEFTTLSEELKVIENFTVDYLDKSLGLNWIPPKGQQFCITAYTVSAVGPDMNKTSITWDASFLVMDLKPCGTYNISVAAIDIDGNEGKSIMEAHKVKFEKPERVEEVNIYPNATSLYVTWRPPRIQVLCIKEYRITAWENPAMSIFDETTNKTTVFIQNLSSCTNYFVQIIPTAPEGDGNNYIAHDTTSPELLGAPIVSLYEASHDSLRINATVASDDNRCDI